ncbi:MAG TPA: histidinol-phosphate transaminase [Cyclobacteriaceae bacterium]|nr:histidinol-phosphate transaminase [Cyclobacteriaceae bacterium]
MKTNTLSRRQWLKTSTLASGTVALLGSNLSSLIAAPNHANYGSKTFTMPEDELLRNAPPILKARLSSNENPFGPSAKAKKALEEAIDGSFRYPRAYVRDLAEKIASYEGISAAQIVLSAGSGPVLSAAACYFGLTGGSIISADPTYDNIPEDAEGFYQSKWVKIPLTPDYKHDLDAMEKAIDNTTVLVYVCNPNNPTGTVLDSEKLKAFCERVSKRVPVFVDEAYIDYTDNPNATTLIDCVKKGQNVIVARTFSKLYGFAGLRMGYMIAQPDVIDKLAPYLKGARSISATTANAAMAAYQDKEFLKEALEKTEESKQFLYSILKKAGYDYIPSYTNFVLFPIKMDGKRFTDEMMKRGVSVRFWKFNDKDWCRVSIGTMDEMKSFEEAFVQIA